MPSSLDLQLDRLKELIARVGPEPLFSAPLVTPEDTWFPDRWSPDLESVRRIMLRLAEYAGLTDLDVEVVADKEPDEIGLPLAAIEQRARMGVTRMFDGIHDGCAWFAIDDTELPTPKSLVGVLAREVALAWRHVRGIHVEARREEEEETDVAAIFLGFGIVVCNAAFEYKLSGGRYPQLYHTERGLIDVEDLAGLLACWAKVKQCPEREILRHLGPTQRDGFRKTWARWSEDELRERLAIPDASAPAGAVLEGASRREFKLSRAATSAHEVVQRLVAAAGEDGGLAGEPVAYPVSLIGLPRRMLAMWWRLSTAGTWTRTLALVSDPEWDTQAIVLVAQTGDEVRRHALGHVRDRDAQDPHRLQKLLEPAFRSGSPFRSLLVPSLPTYVGTMEGAGHFGLKHLEPMFLQLANESDPAQVAKETEWLELYGDGTPRRLEFERQHGGMPDLPPKGSGGSRRWWKTVSDSLHASDELRFMRSSVRSESRPATSDPPAAPPALPQKET